MSKIYTRSFNGGIISPEMYGRLDDVKYNTGLARCNNMIVLPQGPVVNRAGTQFVREVKDSSKYTRMLPFRYSTTQTTAIEAGEAYFRFHTFGATLTTPTTSIPAYASGSTYSAGDIVSEGGKTWYAVRDVPTSTTPSTNEYSNTPVVSSTWSETVGQQLTLPVGYELVGDELPETVEVGKQIAITIVVYTRGVYGSNVDEGSEFNLNDFVFDDPIGTTYYVGYTGVSVTSPSGYWLEMGAIYEIPSPYAEIDLKDINYVQSADVLTLVHPKYAPRELRRVVNNMGDIAYTLSEIQFGSELTAPTIQTVAATNPNSPVVGPQGYNYVATTVSDDQLDESEASTAASVTGQQLFDTGAYNTITLATPITRHNIYKQQGGLYGYIGQITTASMIDDNIAPDMSKTPPENRDPFTDPVTPDYPRATAYFEQRRVFGGTPLKPQTFFMSKTGVEDSFDYSIPVRDDDSIEVRMASREANTIRHIVPIGDLVIFTDSAEWRVTSVNSDAITPTSIVVRPQSYIGANHVQPVVVSTQAVYAAARGGHVRSLGYDFNVNGYVSVDLSIRAAHLFDYKTITGLAYAKGPIPIVWATSSDGLLLGLTYIPEQQVYAWHTHETQGNFESVCTVGEGNDDVCYVVVKRTIGETTKRYVERLGSRYHESIEEFFGVDSGLTYRGSPVTTISGLSHLEGCEVAILADGAVQARQTVTGGQVTLEAAASVVHVGHPIRAEIQTLPVAAEIEALAQATIKTAYKATMRVYRSSGFSAGTRLDNLIPAKIRTDEAYGTPPALRTGEIDVELNSGWSRGGQIIVRQDDPVPLEISALTVHIQMGG
jgi:hypothetical protein